MSQVKEWPEAGAYMTPQRARLLRLDIDEARRLRGVAPSPLAPAFRWHPEEEPPELHPAGPPPVGPAPGGVPVTTRAGDHPCAWCSATPTRRFIAGWLCTACAPVQPVPDPNMTMPALVRRRRALLALVTMPRRPSDDT